MTPEAQALVELADRCEAATGADRAIDAEIAVRLDVKTAGSRYTAAYLHSVGNSYEDIGAFTQCPAFTASLDAAMTLVPEGWAWSLDGGDPSCDDSASLGPVPGPGQMMNPSIITGAATPALALTAASLRALASLEKLERVDNESPTRERKA